MAEKNTDKQLNILYVVGDCGLDLTINQGYRIHILKILEGLKKAEHEIYLITINDKKELKGFIDYLCIPHRYLRFKLHKIFPYFGFIDSIFIFFNILKLHKKKKFDVIHERYGLYSYGGAFAAKILKLPYILEVNAPIIEEKQLHTIPLRCAQKWAALLNSTYCLNQADRIIAVSTLLKNYMVNNWGIKASKIYILPNAADIESFENVSSDKVRAKYNLKNRIIIGFVGSLHKWYGIENLLKAFAIAQKSNNNLILMIIGDGQYRKQLENLTEKLKISDQTIFTGNIPHSEIPEYINAFDIAIAPYRDLPTGFYNSPIKLFEYMAAGKAIIASKIGQIDEIVEHKKTAWLVPPGNIKALSEAIIYLTKNPKIRNKLARNSRDLAVRNYSWRKYISKLESIYFKFK